MAPPAKAEKFVFVMLWIAFACFVVSYLRAVSSAGDYITYIEKVTSHVAEANATIDDLKYELSGASGFAAQLEDSKKQKKDVEDKIANHPKAMEEKTAAVTKAEANVKTITEENQKAKAAVAEWTAKLDACNSNSTCVDRVQNVTDSCIRGTTEKPKGKSLLGKIFGAS